MEIDEDYVDVDFINEQINDKHHKILSLCISLSKKGIDAFYSYSPHVDWADVRVYTSGWAQDNDPDLIFSFLWSDITRDGPVDSETVSIVMSKFDKCIFALEGLLND
ncbi:hypothetical protein CPT_Minot_080 [Acinetobacter phage Minot]|nr:hypothetical protein CPT_Minot_080 [Acinetobacter phage Minot]QQO96531.1 hypothetical protein CPT_Mokit_080 [Acinetobacter phage Mokit]QQO96786.1 hypothetical protein CPT_Melin_085 [Acinetobacter phage Melin]